LETLSADLERYADPDEAVEQKIKQNTLSEWRSRFVKNRSKGSMKKLYHLFEHDRMDENSCQNDNNYLKSWPKWL
jgi:predicted thioredoxin/glutaredoxin